MLRNIITRGAVGENGTTLSQVYRYDVTNTVSAWNLWGFIRMHPSFPTLLRSAEADRRPSR